MEGTASAAGGEGVCGALTYFDMWRNIMHVREFMNMSKALADANRVRVLLALRRGELCACQLTELFGLAPSTMSKHLSILSQAQLVKLRKQGRWAYYSLPGKEAAPPIKAALDWVELSLRESEQAVLDAKHLKQVLKTDPTALCRKQSRG